MEKLELNFKEMQVFFLTCGKIINGEFVYFGNNKKGWFVENRGNTYNAQLFAQGIKKIFELDGKRGEYYQLCAKNFSKIFEDEFSISEVNSGFNCQNKWYCSEEYTDFVKFVYDVALEKKDWQK